MTNVVPMTPEMFDAPAAPAAPEIQINFDTFWLLYPRHDAKKPAKLIFERLPDDQKLAAILGIVAWRPLMLKQDPQFLPMARTWLYQERWEDELPAAPTISAAAHVPFKPSSPHEPAPRGAIPAAALDVIRKLTGRRGPL